MSSKEQLQALAERLAQATGSDRDLDAAIGTALGSPISDFTASVDRCVDLAHHALPGWSWHVGWDATGVLPYATMHREHQHFQIAAPTVPLALVRAIVQAKLSGVDQP